MSILRELAILAAISLAMLVWVLVQGMPFGGPPFGSIVVASTFVCVLIAWFELRFWPDLPKSAKESARRFGAVGAAAAARAMLLACVAAFLPTRWIPGDDGMGFGFRAMFLILVCPMAAGYLYLSAWLLRQPPKGASR